LQLLEKIQASVSEMENNKTSFAVSQLEERLNVLEKQAADLQYVVRKPL